ncbi:MAG: dihydrolipoyllysine-residue acetyltransferase [Ignavibacteria bacterium]|jgi:pyruvate dehydrogenase E2 component (dihydrolipoamide acetyltransferase)|nr:dihydrolipoyllysine-residue acetyltransferase [Ignavibacteria bacterium]MCU7504381.1 dihydrolipoyllysine-residue acetyltransferase [Ignavibacteria bacterium]MCU7517604.1 dihydrolipoyllysine-residue acetyltransferase [Ignavibacteria bacterium]
MAKEFTLPELGENIASADVLQVLIKVGDQVKADQTVLEIETDKATIEVPSTITGIVKEVNVKPGDKAKVGQVIFTVEESSDAAADEKQAPNEAAKPQEKARVPEVRQEEEAVKEDEVKAQATIQPGVEAKGGSVEFKLPELGENIGSADILQVKVSPGDKVKKDQIILEIETDKATIEVPSDIEGVVEEVLVKAGEKASVGQVIFRLRSSEGPGQERQQQLEMNKKQEEAEKGGAKVTPEQVKPSGKPEKKAPEEAGTTVIGGQPPRKTYIMAEERPPVDPGKIAPAAPTVRRFAREIGVNINEVPGTGPGGRISINDVKTYARETASRPQRAEAPAAGGVMAGIATEPLPDFSKWGQVESKDMSNIRRKTAEHLSYAWATVPHVTQFDKADITELERLRKMYGAHAEKQGGKLTVTAILLKVIASALKAFPQFNSSVDMAHSAVIYKKYYHVGVAVDTDRGLLVPVIRDVDKKNIVELAVELNQVAEKARNRKLSLEDMQGGCFTITNLGGIGGTYFSPIINSPEVAILGLSRSSYEQVYRDGKFETRLMLPLSLSYDHRIIDGADGARFLRWVAGAVEQPFLMALEG